MQRLGDDAAPLDGIVVLDLSNILAAPIAATLLGEFGARVLKVEEPGRGDFPRHHGPSPGARTPQWAQEGRNKESVTIDLRRPEGQQIARRLAAGADVAVTNFRPATAERWGLSPQRLGEENDQLVVLSITGYGLSGPYRDRGAFDRVTSAYSGHTYVSGYPDRPPVRGGFAVIDYMSAYLGAFAVLAALRARDRGAGGQVIDLALYEAALRSSEAAVTELVGAGHRRERVGNRHPGIVPATEALARDGRWVSYHAGTQPIFERLVEAMGQPHLAGDERFATRRARVVHQDELYQVIASWVGGMEAAEAVRVLNDVGVPSSVVNSLEDLLTEEHIVARRAFQVVDDDDFGPLPVVAPVPRLSKTPGTTRHLGPPLGSSTKEVLQEFLGMDQQALEALEVSGVI